MSTSASTVEFIEDQLRGLPIRTARMFGEYAVYLDEKVVAFVCNDTLFIKPVGLDVALLEGTGWGHVYPGSKLYHEVPGDLLEDSEWLQRAIQATADALPVPPPKKPRTNSASSGGTGR